MFPSYLAMGMSYQEFWHCSPTLTRAYYKAEQIRTQKESDYQWLQGKYIYDALCAALSNFSAGLNGKVGKAQYMKEPIRLVPKSKEELEAENRRKLEAYIEELKMYKSQFDARHKEKGK